MSDDLEFEIYMHQHVDAIADEFEEFMRQKAREEGEEFAVDPKVKADAKHIIKQIVPAKGPEVMFYVVAILGALMMVTHAEATLIKMVEDEGSMEALMQKLRETGSGTSAIDMMEKRHAKKATRYKNVDVQGENMKIADLGDVGKGISFN